MQQIRYLPPLFIVFLVLLCLRAPSLWAVKWHSGKTDKPAYYRNDYDQHSITAGDFVYLKGPGDFATA